MESPSPTYRLDALHLEHVLENFKREHDRVKLTPFQRTSFTLLQIAAYTIPLALLLIWLLSDVATSENSRLAKLAEPSCYAAALVLILATIGMVVLVPMNLWLVRTIVRQARLDRQLGKLVPGAGDVTVAPARTPSQQLGLKILAGASLVLVAAASALAILGGEDRRWKLPIALVVFGGPAFFILSKKKLPFLALRIGLGLLAALVVAGVIVAFVVPDLALVVAALLVVVLLPALVLVSNRYLSRLRERMHLLEDVDRLRASLARYRQEAKTDGVGFVELPSAEAERLVAVERSLIRQRRVAAIASAREGSESGRTIFKTVDARAQIEALDRRTRLLVESRLEELSFEPRPEGVAEDPAAGSLRLAVPGTAVEIVYEVADELAQVRLLAVETAAGEVGPSESPEGSGDA